MMLIAQTQVPDAALPVAEFRDHLQLGSGFADDGLQNAVLAAEIRAALEAVEGETGKVLIARTYQFVMTAWRDLARQVLPVAPVTAIQSLTITDLAGGAEVIPAEKYRLAPDFHEPALCWTGWALPTIPVGGTAEIVFDAGFGAAWADVPADLRQAVLIMAAHFYDNRSVGGTRAGELPGGVAAIARRYKPIRIFGGGRR